MSRHERLYNTFEHYEEVRELLLNDYAEEIELRHFLQDFVKWHVKTFKCSKISSYRVANELRRIYHDDFKLIQKNSLSEIIQCARFVEEKLGITLTHNAKCSLTAWLKNNEASEEALLKWHENYLIHHAIRKGRKLNRAKIK